MRIVIAVATANGALRSFLAKQRPNVVPQGTVQKGYFAERQARFFVQLQAIDEKVSADSLGAWLRRIANPADALILLIDKDSRHLVQSYEDAYFIAEIPEYPGSVMQNQVSATLAPIIRHFGNFCRLFDSQKNQKVFLLPLDIFKAVDLKRLRDRLTIFKSPSRISYVTTEPSDEDQGGSGIEEGCCGADCVLEVLCEAAIAVDPGEGALDDPASGMDDEPGLIGELADDLDGDRGGVRDAHAVVGAVGESAFDEGMPQSRLLEQWHRAVAILHIGRVDEQCERTSVGIDHGVALAPHHLLARVVAA